MRTDPARVLEIDDPHDLARARALAPLLDTRRAAHPRGHRRGRPRLRRHPDRRPGAASTPTDARPSPCTAATASASPHLRRAGLELLILSTEQNPVVAARARKLRVPVLHGIDRKDLALKQWCEEQGIAPERVLYVGNDVNDLPCFDLVGWPVAVASAHDSVRAAARAVTTTPGGDGAIREIAAWLLGPTLTPLNTPEPPPAHTPPTSKEPPP